MMKSSSAFQLLPLVLFFIGIEDISGVDPYGVDNLFSSEAKEVMENLQQYKDTFDNEIVQLSVNLKDDNHILTEYKKYLEAYELSKDTPCKHGDPPGENDKEVIDVFVNTCVESGSLPKVDMEKLNKKVKEAIGKIKSIDKTLKDITESCRNKPSTCKERKKKPLSDLEKVFSSAESDSIRSMGTNIARKGKNQLGNCFADETEGLLKELVDALREINDCMRTQDVMVIEPNT